MMWTINGEEFVFDSWEQLGIALRELGRKGLEIKIICGPICEACNGQGEIAGFVGSPNPIYMECFECNALGIKH